jgi:hypothetical protein
MGRKNGWSHPAVKLPEGDHPSGMVLPGPQNCTLAYMSEVTKQDALEHAGRVGRNITAAREKLEAAMEEGRGAALEAIASGNSELAVAQQMNLNRLTVRRWQGKREWEGGK